jgi:hypothetical protein
VPALVTQSRQLGDVARLDGAIQRVRRQPIRDKDDNRGLWH